jgi:hypothetical protein
MQGQVAVPIVPLIDLVVKVSHIGTVSADDREMLYGEEDGLTTMLTVHVPMEGFEPSLPKRQFYRLGGVRLPNTGMVAFLRRAHDGVVYSPIPGTWASDGIRTRDRS